MSGTLKAVQVALVKPVAYLLLLSYMSVWPLKVDAPDCRARPDGKRYLSVKRNG
jgi:hypothetical protein